MASIAALACSDDTERTEYRDQSPACVASAANGSLAVTVEFASCLSSSCSNVSDNTCNLTLTGTEIHLQSAATIERHGGSCSDDCVTASATCSLPNLDPGTYSVIHGNATETLELPTPGTVLFPSSSRTLCSQGFSDGG